MKRLAFPFKAALRIAFAILAAVPCSASFIKVGLTLNGDNTVTIKIDGLPNPTTHLDVCEFGAGGAGLNGCAAGNAAGGSFTTKLFFNNGTGPGDEFHISEDNATPPLPTDEDWYVFPTEFGKTYDVLSSQETKYIFESGDSRLASLPFDQSYVTDGLNVGILDGQFALVNSSSTVAYDFSSLQIYKNLNSAFFTTANFDSPPAIASGTLAADVSNVGGATLAMTGLQNLPDPNAEFPFLIFPLGPVTPGSYELAVGTAAPILANGSLGQSTPFSIGIEVPTPEPGLSLLSGLLLLILLSRARQQAL